MNQPHPPSAEEVNRKLIAQYTEIAALAGGLAHEIKNPLSTICLNMELLAEDFVQAETLRDRRAAAKIAVVQQECQRLQNLLDNFLSFAKVRTVRFEASDLNQQVRQVLDFFGPKSNESGVEFVCYFDSDLPSVVLDRESFHGALINLVLNALQAMPQGGQLVARTKTTATGVALELIDSGCGMDARTTLGDIRQTSTENDTLFCCCDERLIDKVLVGCWQRSPRFWVGQDFAESNNAPMITSTLCLPDRNPITRPDFARLNCPVIFFDLRNCPLYVVTVRSRQQRPILALHS